MTVKSTFLKHPSHLGVVAVGFSGGQSKAGVDAAPKELIEAGLLKQLSDELDYTIHWDSMVHSYLESVPPADPPLAVAGAEFPMLNPLTVSNVTRKIADQVYEHSMAGRVVLTLGGDHSIAVGTVGGVTKATRERIGRDPSIIWVDAHADINTPQSSSSGNIHGMPVAFLAGIAKPPAENPEVFGWLEKGHMISTRKIVYIGLRDLDKEERVILRDMGIKAFSMHHVDRHGIGLIMKEVLDYIGDEPIHLSFDVDALDPLFAPSTGTPVRGGLTLREGDYICECVHDSGNLVAMDLVEVNTGLGEDEHNTQTVRAGCSLVRCALGESILL